VESWEFKTYFEQQIANIKSSTSQGDKMKEKTGTTVTTKTTTATVTATTNKQQTTTSKQQTT